MPKLASEIYHNKYSDKGTITYQPTYDQETILDLNLTASEGHLIDILLKLAARDKDGKYSYVSKGEKYHYLDYEKIIGMMPTSFKTKSNITRVVKKLKAVNILKTIKKGRGNAFRVDPVISENWCAKKNKKYEALILSIVQDCEWFIKLNVQDNEQYRSGLLTIPPSIVHYPEPIILSFNHSIINHSILPLTPKGEFCDLSENPKLRKELRENLIALAKSKLNGQTEIKVDEFLQRNSNLNDDQMLSLWKLEIHGLSDLDDKKTKSKKADTAKFKPEAKQAIEYLNEKAGTNFKSNAESHLKVAAGRLEEGYTLDDLKRVVDIKCAQWLGGKMQQYLRPSTLFGKTKFSNYAGENPPKPKLERHHGFSPKEGQEYQPIPEDKLPAWARGDISD